MDSKTMPYGARLKTLRKAMREQGLEALLVTDLINVRYLCGFAGTYGLLVVDGSGAHFVTDGRYAEIAEGMVTGARIHVQPMLEIDEWFQGFFRKRGYRQLGFDGAMSVAQLDNLKARLRAAKTGTVRADGLVEALRELKDAAEVARIAKAARLADKMMAAAWEAAAAGVKETELSLVVRRAAEDLGGEGESFPNIIASGPNGSRPHHRGSSRRLRIGDAITIDLGAVYGGYCSDLTRNPVLGKVSPRFEKIYSVCLDAQKAGVKACVPGAMGKDVDAIVREIIASAGFGEYFVHGLGHGVGLQIHEAPRLNKTSRAILKPGHVVTVEPGIYIPGFGGLRIEDLLLVTEGKPRLLSHAPKELTVLRNR